ncbi:MAG: cysteine-rich VLP protein, partial [Oscillospiraceae bacterium]|nr:cysteine-rich VLP protein [Oscillospiraceae bacterium]
MAIKITNTQSATVQRLLKCCCNWDNGFCILLDEPCPQRTSRNSIICKYFKAA